MPLEQLESEALELPVGDRARLAARLLESLDGEVFDDPAEVEQAWIIESQRRYERHLAGESVAVPAAEALARVRERLQGS